MIGFGNGTLRRIFDNDKEYFAQKYIDLYNLGGEAKAIELNLINIELIKYLKNNSIDLSKYEYKSIHMPTVSYQDDSKSHLILSMVEAIVEKYNIDNCIFHTEKKHNWSAIDSYDIPASIENMDNNKKRDQTMEFIQNILSSYNFGLTLDLQHCFVNDNSMQLAKDFQGFLSNRIVEYHVSGYDNEYNHYPLFKTRQKAIFKNIDYPDKPIIIESTFDKIAELKKELEYIERNWIE